MKVISKIFSALLLVMIVITSCTKDNYDAPESMLTGKVVYEGEALQLRGNETVRLFFYRHDYEKHDPIEVFVNQDGAYSACLFDGEYQLITKSGNGPWLEGGRDTTNIIVSGNTVQNVEVVPYYMIRNTKMKPNGNIMAASFNVEKITGKETDCVFFMLGTVQYINDGEHNVDRFDNADGAKMAEINVTGARYGFTPRDYTDNRMFQTALKRGTLFGHICIWPKGSDQGIYSEVIRLK